MRDLLAEDFFSSTCLVVESPLGLCAWSHSSGRGQHSPSWRRRSGRCGAFRSRHQDPPLHKCREGGHHTNRDTACPLGGMHGMCGSPHSSPAVHGMMRDQVVVATRGLAESCCWRLLLFSLVLTKEGFYNLHRLLSPGKAYPPLLRRYSRRENRYCGKRFRYDGVISLYRVEVVTRDFGTVIQGISLFRAPLYRDHDCNPTDQCLPVTTLSKFPKLRTSFIITTYFPLCVCFFYPFDP